MEEILSEDFPLETGDIDKSSPSDDLKQLLLDANLKVNI